MFRGGMFGGRNRPTYRDEQYDPGGYADYRGSFSNFLEQNRQGEYLPEVYQPASERLDEVGREEGIDPIAHFQYIKRMEDKAHLLAQKGKELQGLYEARQHWNAAEATAQKMRELDRLEGTTWRTEWLNRAEQGIQDAEVNGYRQGMSGSHEKSRTYWRRTRR